MQPYRYTTALVLTLLSMTFMAAVVFADLLTYRIINFASFYASIALFIYPITYIISDITTECWGKRVALTVIIYALCLEIVVDGSLAAITHTASAYDPNYQQAFSIVFSPMFGVVTGNIIGALGGYIVNILVMNTLKRRFHYKHFILRSIFSSLCGEIVYVIIAYTIWFYHTALPDTGIEQLIVVSILFKIIFAIIYAFPARQLSKFLRQRIEQEHVTTPR